MYDPNSLMYVTKEYENTLKEKAKKIYADDVVKTTLDSVNQELDDILLQINNRLDQISNKNDEINAYRADVHRFIDQTSINTSDLADSNTGSTSTYPSAVANKEDRSESSVYNYRNFANRKISLNSFDDIKINSSVPDNDTNLKSFDIKMTDDEVVKVIEYAITYKQNPKVIRKIIDGNITSEEDTVIINRVFRGRFYIIRPDIANHPEQIIVKTVVENADNTSDNKDIKVLNVRAMKDSKETQTFDNIGPEFDLYFTVRSADTLTICVGDVTPYKWVMRKSSYMVGEDAIPATVNLIVGNMPRNVNKIEYSKVLNGYLLGTTDNSIYFTTDNYFKEENIIKLDNIKYTGENFWIVDTNTVVFIHSGNKTYVSDSDITVAQDLNIDVSVIKQLSTGEIIGALPNYGLIVFNTSSNTFNNDVFVTIDGEKNTDTASHAKLGFSEDEDGETPINSVSCGIDFIEIDNKLLVSSTNGDKLQYFVVPLNGNTNTYYGFTMASNVVSTTIEDYSIANASSTKIQLINTPVGVFDLVKVNGKTENISAIYNLRDLNINSKNYVYSRFEKLKLFNPTTQLEYSDSSVVFDRIYETSLGSFAITDDNKLYCFDDSYIIKANTTREIFQTTTTGSEEDENLITSTTSLGYDDDQSFIKLDSSERYDNLYYTVENPYLNKVIGLFETASGIYIIDECGVYELTADLTLKTKYFSNTKSITSFSRDKTNNKRTVIVDNIGTTSSIYYMNDIIEENSSTKLRYNYIDLFTGKYTKYTDSITNYDYDTASGAENPLIKFTGKLYVSLVDITGSLYNTYSSENIIKYSENKYTYGDINPEVDHTVEFNVDVVADDGTVNKTTELKTVETKMFILRTNKYGFINYEGFNTENLSSDNISDINNQEIFKINHKSSDTDISFEDIRNQILKLMYNNNKKVASAVGKTEYQFIRTNVFDIHKVRSLPAIELGFNVEKLGKLQNNFTVITDKNELKFLNLDSESIAVNTNVKGYITGFKDTTVGSFVWGGGIMLYPKGKLTEQVSFTNQLTGYDVSVDGSVLDIVDCRDSRQTILIVCEKTIYAYICRLTVGSTFSTPFTSTTNLQKLTYSAEENAIINKVFVVDEGEKRTIYISYNAKTANRSVSDDDIVYKPFLASIEFTDENKIVLKEVFGSTKILNINSKFKSINLIRKLNNKLIITMEGSDILIYDLDTENFTVLKEHYSTQYYNGDMDCGCDVEDEDYYYFTSVGTGLYRLNKKTLVLENIDNKFTSYMTRINGRIYTFTEGDIGEEAFSWYDTKENKFYPISKIPITENGNVIKLRDHGIYRDHFYGDETGVYWVSSGNPNYLNQVVDSEYAYKYPKLHKYNSDDDQLINYRALNNVTSDDYYDIRTVNDNLQIFKNGVAQLTTDGDLGKSFKVYNLTTDSAPQSGKTYYTISGKFSRAFNIKTYDSLIRYYIENKNYVYTQVNTENSVPEVGVDYYVRNLAGQYVSAGYNFSQFTPNINYYTRSTGYKYIKHAPNEYPINTEKYFVCFDPIYTPITDIGTAFDSNIDYYELSEDTATFGKTEFKYALGFTNNVALIFKNETYGWLTQVYNVITHQTTIIPFKAEEFYDTNIGVFMKYTKNTTTNEMNFAYLSKDLSQIVYDVDEEQITDGYGDLIEINVDKNKTYLDEQDIFICGRFGLSGKVLKYIPSSSDISYNKFHPVANNSNGFKRLFHIDSDCFAIESYDQQLNIHKYDTETKEFKSNYIAREFSLANITYKIDKSGKEDVYIIGSGDYNIYKSYNNSFKPVFTWYNKIIGTPKYAFSDKKFIYIWENEKQFRIINNDSDEYFYKNYGNSNINIVFDPENSVIPSFGDDNVAYDNDRTYIGAKFYYDFNLDEKYIGKPHIFQPVRKIQKFYTDVGETKYNEDFNFDLQVAHALDHKIKNCPILSYNNRELIYPCYNTDRSTLLPTGEIQHLYDSDGVTVKKLYPEFDVFVDSEYGTFGIDGNDVYLRQRYINENARWVLINTLRTTGSSFKTIIHTNKLGWILVDKRTVTRFNSKTLKFDIDIPLSNWTYDGTSAAVSISYVKEFPDSNELLIGHVYDPYGANKTIFALQAYRLVNNKYQFVNILADNANATTPITCIKETRFGIMITYASFGTGSISTNTIDNTNYSSFSTNIGLLTDTSNTLVTINTMGSAPSGYTWTGVTGTLIPTDINQITETVNGEIILHGGIVKRATNITVTNAGVSTWLLVNTLKTDDDTVFDKNNWIFVPVHKNTPTQYTNKYLSNSNTGDYKLVDEVNSLTSGTANRKWSYLVLDGGADYMLAYHDHLGWRDNTDPYGAKFVCSNGIIEQVNSTNGLESSKFTYKNENDEDTTINISVGAKSTIVKPFYTNNKWYLLVSRFVDPSLSKTDYKIYWMASIYEIKGYNTENPVFEEVANSFIPFSSTTDQYDYNYPYTRYWGLVNFNGVFIVRIFGRDYIIDSKKLSSVTTEKEQINNSVLYDLKLTIDNNDDWNNLTEKTVNSDLDKFVVKESGVIDLSSYEIKNNDIILTGVNKNCVDQFFLPHDFYNKTNHTDCVIPYKEMDNNRYLANNIIGLYSAEKNNNLIKNRFISDNNILHDTTGRHTNILLGEIEKYIKNLKSYSITLNIYPTNAVNQAIDKNIGGGGY